MEAKEQHFIKDNRLNMSMNNMAKELGIPYNRVRNYMIENNLQVCKKKVQEIKKKKPQKGNFYTRFMPN